MNGLKKVKIIWEDAWSDTAYLLADAAEHVSPAIRENIGYLLRNDNEVVVLTSGTVSNLFKGQTMIDGLHVIPKAVVKGVIDLTDVL
jgi:hypothetical protein